MIQNRANGVQATVDKRARIRTVVLKAGQGVRTVLVRGALMRQHATRYHRVARGTRRTRATVSSMEINAFGARMTRLILALVDVQAVFGTGNKSVAASEID